MHLPLRQLKGIDWHALAALVVPLARELPRQVF
jgi:hypothetical protein